MSRSIRLGKVCGSARRPRLAVALTVAWAASAAVLTPVHAQKTDRGTVMAERDNKGAGLAIGREPVTAELRLDNPLREAIKAAALADRTDPNAPVVSLRVNGLFPARPAWSGAQVFLNLPAVPEDLDPDLLSPKSPHYAGSFSFFPKSGKMLNFLAPRAAAALKGIVERGELKNDTLRVTLVGIPGDEEREREAVRDGATVPFSQVSLHVRPRASHPGATP